MSGSLHEVSVTCPVAGADVRQCLYAAAFIVPGVADVRLDGETWTFSLEQPVPAGRLAERVNALVARYAQPAGEPVSVFRLDPPQGHVDPGLPAELAGIERIAQGLDVWSGPMARMVRFLDDAILRRFVPAFRPREETYPNVIPVESLWRANHLSGFPEHLHFVTHLESDVEGLDAFAQKARAGRFEAVAPQETPLAPARLVHNPSTCYHCYALRAGRDIGPDHAITAITRCHRYEAINHREPGRLLEFSMREVIFLGSPDYVRATRVHSLELVEQLVGDWQLHGALVTANDPFFSSDFANKASHQHRMAMKYEYRALLPPHRPLSVLSSNLHGPTFSRAFGITQDRRPINTGCIGFGLERLALAIVAQHGASPEGWPAGLRGDFERFVALDPMGG